MGLVPRDNKNSFCRAEIVMIIKASLKMYYVIEHYMFDGLSYTCDN